jgi:quinol-cytochrome oxidoreductase complex cytochrome b subunit
MIRDFIAHLFPRTVRRDDLRFTVTFCLGGLAFTAFITLVATGALLAFHYVPSPGGAYRSIASIDADVSGGRYLRAMHRLASHAFLVLVGLHALRVAVRGAYRPPREMNWLLGCALMALAVASAWTGTLLPMDQPAIWATQTGTELIRTLPMSERFVGWLAPDGVGRAGTLLRFYLLHVLLLPGTVAAVSALHFYRVRKNRGVLPWL